MGVLLLCVCGDSGFKEVISRALLWDKAFKQQEFQLIQKSE